MKYHKKPVVVEALQWTGMNEADIYRFTNGEVHYCANDCRMIVPTLEGDMEASVGDYIIKGVNGEFYPCKPDIFAKTYEEVEE